MKIKLIACLAVAGVAVLGIAAAGYYGAPHAVAAAGKVRLVVREIFAISAKTTEMQSRLAKLEDGGRPGPTGGEDFNPVEVEQLREDIQVLSAKLDHIIGGDKKRPEHAGWLPVDASDIYQKSGLLEFYGMHAVQRRSGPVSADGLAATTSARKSWLVWTPSHEETVSANPMQIELDPASTMAGTMRLAIVLSDGRSIVGTAHLGPEVTGAGIPGTAPARPLDIPADVQRPFERPDKMIRLLQVAPNRFVARLPLSIDTRSDGWGQADIVVRRLILQIEHATPAAFLIRSLGLADSVPGVPAEIRGKVTGGRQSAGEAIELEFERGGKRTVQLASDGSFAFPDVPTDQPISLRYHVQGRPYFSVRGRWFQPRAGLQQTNIIVGPEFNNPTGAPPNPKDVAIKTATVTDDGVGFMRYAPNARTSWPGQGPAAQEFEGRSFANAAGFLDRDRDVLNRDRCLRIFAIGGSTFVGLQVKPGDKFTTVLEAELGRRLGRCVEVISAGRDNGDIAANYRTIRHYGAKFKPDVILFEHMSFFATQMEPELLKRTIGWSYEYNVLDNFYFDAAGKLQFRSADESWPLSAVQPSQEPLIPGLNIWHSFHIPEADFVPQARSSVRLMEAVIARLKQEFPSTRLVLATGKDQAGCNVLGLCEGTFSMPDGRSVPKSVRVFLDNVSALCKRAGIACLHPPIPAAGGPEASGIVYVNDGHYTVTGHLWLAWHLADQLEPMLKGAAEASR